MLIEKRVAMLKENEDLDMFKAIENNDLFLLLLLIKVGFDKNERDKDGITPLHYACFHCKFPFPRITLKRRISWLRN